MWGVWRGGESRSEMCLGQVRGVISYPGGSGCIMLHRGEDVQGLCLECGTEAWVMGGGSAWSLPGYAGMSFDDQNF